MLGIALFALFSGSVYIFMIILGVGVGGFLSYTIKMSLKRSIVRHILSIKSREGMKRKIKERLKRGVDYYGLF